MVNEFIEATPKFLLNQCRGARCGTLGPAQVAWCYANPGYCGVALAAAAEARDAAARLRNSGILTFGEQNAFRHTLWLALMVGAYDIPTDLALGLGVAHELDGTAPGNTWGSDNSMIDLHNNFVGARIGEAVRAGAGNGLVDPGSQRATVFHYVYVFVRYGDPCPSCPYVFGGN
jgi:hypothetical protein